MHGGVSCKGEDGEISLARGGRAFATRQRTITPHLSGKGGQAESPSVRWEHLEQDGEDLATESALDGVRKHDQRLPEMIFRKEREGGWIM